MAGLQSEGLASDFRADCERVYREWHERAKALDTDGLLALYSEDAVLESPLVPAILDDKQDGVLRGHDELRRFFGRRRSAAPQRPRALVPHRRMVDGWSPLAGLGVPAAGTRRRPGGPCRIHGDRWRTDRLPPHLLGLERLHADRACAVPSRIVLTHSGYVRARRSACRRR